MRAFSTLTTILLALASTAWASSFYLTAQDVGRIRKHWTDYVYAAHRVGVPVEILPAIHYRESNLSPGKNLGGPFMLDRGPADDPVEFKRRIRAYEKMVNALYRYSTGTPRVSQDFRFAALVAAHELKAKARGRGLADAVWGYNGRASWHQDPDGNRSHVGSAYVWNDPLYGILLEKRFRNRAGYFVEYVDTRPGVMVLYAEIRALRRRCLSSASSLPPPFGCAGLGADGGVYIIPVHPHKQRADGVFKNPPQPRYG